MHVNTGFAWPWVDHGVWITTRHQHFLHVKLVDTRKNNIVLAEDYVNAWDATEEDFREELKLIVADMVEEAKTVRANGSYLDKYVGTFFGHGA